MGFGFDEGQLWIVLIRRVQCKTIMTNEVFEDKIDIAGVDLDFAEVYKVRLVDGQEVF